MNLQFISKQNAKRFFQNNSRFEEGVNVAQHPYFFHVVLIKLLFLENKHWENRFFPEKIY